MSGKKKLWMQFSTSHDMHTTNSRIPVDVLSFFQQENGAGRLSQRAASSMTISHRTVVIRV